MKLHPAYKAIKSVADKTGIIKSFRTDLTRHDKAAINENPNSKFLWFMYEDGTHILMIEENPVSLTNQSWKGKWRIDGIYNSFSSTRNHTFLWNGKSLRHITAAEAISIASTNYK
jgi:hypothetical protein